MKPDKFQRITIRLDSGKVEKLEDLAVKQGRPLSNLIRFIIHQFLSTKKSEGVSHEISRSRFGK